MDHDVGAQAQGLLKPGSGEGVVHDHQSPLTVRHLGHSSDVDDAQARQEEGADFPGEVPDDAKAGRAIVAAQGKQEFIDALARGAVNVRTTTPATFAEYVADQYQRWGKLAKEINLEAE